MMGKDQKLWLDLKKDFKKCHACGFKFAARAIEDISDYPSKD